MSKCSKSSVESIYKTARNWSSSGISSSPSGSPPERVPFHGPLTAGFTSAAAQMVQLPAAAEPQNQEQSKCSITSSSVTKRSIFSSQNRGLGSANRRVGKMNGKKNRRRGNRRRNRVRNSDSRAFFSGVAKGRRQFQAREKGGYHRLVSMASKTSRFFSFSSKNSRVLENKQSACHSMQKSTFTAGQFSFYGEAKSNGVHSESTAIYLNNGCLSAVRSDPPRAILHTPGPQNLAMPLSHQVANSSGKPAENK